MLEGLRLLVVDDREDHGYACSLMVRSLGGTVETVTSGREALVAVQERNFDIALIDYMMPEMDGMELLAKLKREDANLLVVMMTAFGSIPSAIEAVKIGAFDYLTKPFGMPDLERVLGLLIQQKGAAIEGRRLRDSLTEAEAPLASILGSSPAMLKVLDLVRRAGPSDSTILIQGESGTGKELIARAVHGLSARRAAPFVTVDCGSIAPSLIQSELFGHTRGSFTGATQSTEGLIRSAHGGSLFLDEVGELPLELQTQLLRAIQERKIRPVGSNAYHDVDVRFLAATNKDLEQAVQAGSFRQDLFYRLHVVQIRVPALRERAGDIPLLAQALLERLAPAGRPLPSLSAATLDHLESYPWPGNVRELENVMERALALGAGPTLTPDDLPPHVVAHQQAELEDPDGPLAIDVLEREAIERALEKTGGDKARAAKLLGIDRSTLYRKLKRYGLGGRVA